MAKNFQNSLLLLLLQSFGLDPKTALEAQGLGDVRVCVHQCTEMDCFMRIQWKSLQGGRDLYRMSTAQGWHTKKESAYPSKWLLRLPRLILFSLYAYRVICTEIQLLIRRRTQFRDVVYYIIFCQPNLDP